MAYFYLIVAVLLNSVANVLLKVSSAKGIQMHGAKLATITDNYIFIIGLGCFALNVVFYFLALSQINLSIAYPIMVGATFLLVNIIAFLFLKEQVHLTQFIGYICIILGILLVLGFKQG